MLLIDTEVLRKQTCDNWVEDLEDNPTLAIRLLEAIIKERQDQNASKQGSWILWSATFIDLNDNAIQNKMVYAYTWQEAFNKAFGEEAKWNFAETLEDTKQKFWDGDCLMDCVPVYDSIEGERDEPK